LRQKSQAAMSPKTTAKVMPKDFSDGGFTVSSEVRLS
jgi:hypothetical protein